MSVEGIAATLAVVVAVATYLHTGHRERIIRRAELVRAYTAEFYDSDEVVDLFVDIDYSRFTFVEDQDTWLSKEPEKRLVRMLDLFNSIGHNVDRKVMSVRDIHGTTLGYAILRAAESPGVQDYLRFVKRWDRENLGTGIPFEYFQTLAVALDKRSQHLRLQNADASAVLDSLAGSVDTDESAADAESVDGTEDKEERPRQ